MLRGLFQLREVDIIRMYGHQHTPKKRIDFIETTHIQSYLVQTYSKSCAKKRAKIAFTKTFPISSHIWCCERTQNLPPPSPPPRRRSSPPYSIRCCSESWKRARRKAIANLWPHQAATSRVIRARISRNSSKSPTSADHVSTHCTALHCIALRCTTSCTIHVIRCQSNRRESTVHICAACAACSICANWAADVGGWPRINSARKP